MEENYSIEGNELHVVRNHKDTVFRMLYNDKEKLLELYNGMLCFHALNGTAYENTDDMEICTLENAIYMGFKNDVSFLFDSEMNLYEHQSSFNPNMPLRDLLYIARQLEKYVVGKTLYSSCLLYTSFLRQGISPFCHKEPRKLQDNLPSALPSFFPGPPYSA